jgi:ATP-dependent helicase/nuclease subunit B
MSMVEGSRTEGRVTFSYSCRDTREFRETYASWLMLQAYRLQQGDAEATYQQMKAALGEPASLVPSNRDASIASAGWWLRSVVSTGDAGATRVGIRFPSLEHGRIAAAQRKSDAFTEYDGHVPEAGRALDPSAPGITFSVTDLEGAASCPFRLFLKRGLGIRPVGGDDRDRDVWLDPLTRGAELHDLYALALRRCRDENRGVNLDRDLLWLRAQAEKRLRVLHEEMPAASDEILTRESAEFLDDVELFLRAEAEREAGRTPVAFEVSFGRPLGGDEEPLAREEPVEISLGKGLTFRISGRIDRIDRVGDAFEVIDYKTGRFWRKDWTGTFKGGRRLQHALYGLAATELLKTLYPKVKVASGTYYFSSHKGRGERISIPRPDTAATAAVLADLRDVIREGRFAHAAGKDACRYCDYKGACDGTLEKRAESKLDDSALKAFVRLGGHE